MPAPDQTLTINTRDAKGRIWDSTYQSTDANGVSSTLASHVTYDTSDNLASVSAADGPDAVLEAM